MRYRNSEICAHDWDEKTSYRTEKVSAAYQQHQIPECKGKAYKCEEEHKYGESEPKILWIDPNEDNFGWTFEGYEEHDNKNDKRNR